MSQRQNMSFFELADGGTWVQEDGFFAGNYLIKDGKPLNQKKIIQYLQKRANASISDKLQFRRIGKSYLFNNGIDVNDALMERLKKQEDLKDFLEKIPCEIGDYEIQLGDIYEAKDMTEAVANEETEYETGYKDITMEEARKIAFDNCRKYSKFLTGLDMIKEGKL
jgi:protein involved in sex pheromone biosynthesis